MTEDARNRPLRVAQFIGTRVSDPERGPQVRMSPTIVLPSPTDILWASTPTGMCCCANAGQLF